MTTLAACCSAAYGQEGRIVEVLLHVNSQQSFESRLPVSDTHVIDATMAQQMRGTRVGLLATGYVDLTDWRCPDQPECHRAAWTVDLPHNPFLETTGVVVAPDSWQEESGLLLVPGDLHVRAQTALRGSGGVELEGAQPQQVLLEGKIDFAQGTIINQFDDYYGPTPSVVTVAGAGVLGTYRAGNDTAELHIGKADGSKSAQLTIETLNIPTGTVTVHDTREERGQIRWGNALTLARVTAQSRERAKSDSSPSARIAVLGNGTLVLGASMHRANKAMDKRLDILARADESIRLQARLMTVLGDADMHSDRAHRSTLVLAADFDAGNLDPSVAIDVGEQGARSTGGIHVHNDGRLIVYYDDASLKADIAPESMTVHLDEKAQVLLHGWDGKATIGVRFEGPLTPDNFFSMAGVRARVRNGRIERMYCHEMPGLRAVNLVRAVENSSDVRQGEFRAGYRFVVDSYPDTRIGSATFANTIDAAVFLPVTSGLAAVFERANSETLDAVMDRDMSLFEDKGHWWARASARDSKAPRLFAGGNGAWGFQADTVSGTLGYDTLVGKDWIVGLALTAGGSDIHSVGENIAATVCNLAFAGAIASVARQFDNWGEWRIGVGYMRAKSDAKQLINEHTLLAEPTMTIGSVALRWHQDHRLDSSLAAQLYVRPMLQLGVHWARIKDTEIVDRAAQIAATGFLTRTDKRIWASARVGAHMRAECKLWDYHLAPEVRISYATTLGDRDWRITTSLFDGAGASSATWASAQTQAVQMGAGIVLAKKGHTERMTGGIFGLGAKPTGEFDPYSWRVQLDVAYRFASHGERDIGTMLTYRELF